MGVLMFEGIGAGSELASGAMRPILAIPAYSLAQWLMLAFGIALLAVLAVVALLIVQLLGQNGRVMARLDRIESALEDADIDVESDDVTGLPVGSHAPGFSLSGAYGETMTLDALRSAAKPVLLIFTDPRCGFCETTLEDATQWERELAETLTFAVIADGAADKVRKKMAKHKLRHLLVEQRSQVSKAFRVTQTPSAVLVRPDGTIGSGLVAGVDPIRALVTEAREGREPASERAAKTRVRRGAAGIGNDAPVIALQNLDGEVIRLADFAGHPTAVLFWNPGCGFCQRMLPDLKAWEENPPGNAPRLLIVSTGDTTANRTMGLRSPIVLDQGFAVGQSFGASGTPSVRIVGPDGKIASKLVVGGPDVMELLRS